MVLAALQDKVAFFVTPSQLAEQRPEAGRRFRLGGLVVDGSIRREADGSVSFAITDTAQEVPSPITACCRTCSATVRAW